MKIYDKSDRLLLDITPDDNSYRNRAIMGENDLTLYFSLPTHIELPIGAYCSFEGETYTLMRPEQFKMKHNRLFEYTVTFSSSQASAKIWKFRNPVDGRLKFPLTAKPIEHLQMFIDNMNRRDTGWTMGECIDDVEKLISYDHDYCWDALTKIANEFKTEFEFRGKRVSLRKVEYNKSYPLPLSYGRGNGFKPNIGRSNSSDVLPVEILFVQGGDRNIDRSKYPKSETLRAVSNGCLLLPVGATIGYDGEHFEGEDGYNPANARHYAVDDLGLSIRNIDRSLTTMAEDSLDRSDDYPKRVGTISSVVAVNAEKNLYDFIDTSIPPELNYEDYLIGEESMAVVFQSGELAGREFDVKYYHEAKTINGTTKAGRRFEIVPQEIDGVMMPGGTFVPAQTDTYAVFNVMLPDSYIRNDSDKSGAEWDMFKSAVKYLFDNEEKKFSFTGELDGIWAKKDWVNIGGRIILGGYIRFTDANFEPDGVLVRITAIKDYINNPHSPKITLSNETISGSVSSTIKQLGSTDVVIEDNHRAALQFTKRRFRDAKETIEMIEAALSDNFSSRINPIAVETMSLLVGDERLQYQFVAAPGSTEVVAHNIEWLEASKQLHAPAGTIQHLTLGIDSIRPSHQPNEYHYWNVGEFTSSSLQDGSVRYYLYIRAQKQYSGNTGAAEFRLETSSHKLEEGDFYWLLCGILNTEYDGERSFATLYGFTEILPGRITADRLLASDGQSYFDMLNAAMKLKDKLVFNENGDGQLKLKGVMVQSQNGIDEAPLGCYRGEYDPTTTYFNGDEVTYQLSDSNPRCTYRCISPTPISGIFPSDSLSWQITAAGVQGKDGSSISIKGSILGHFGTISEWDASGLSSSRSGAYLIDSDLNTGETASEETKYCIIKLFGVPSPNHAPGWMTKYAEPGDAYIMSNNESSEDGNLFVADTNKWVNVGKIKGETGTPGEDGQPGNFTEYRFAVNGSTTTAPALVTNALNPSGWSTAMPTVNKGYYLWMTKAVKNGTGTILRSQWSTPVRMTPQDGNDGKDGLSPALVFRGSYSPTKTYYGNANRIDCVSHNNAYYAARVDAPDGIKGFKGIIPTNTKYWNVFGSSFESVATSLLLAENANIANLIFRNQRLESTDKNIDNHPNLLLDGINGSMYVDGSIINPFKRIKKSNLKQNLKYFELLGEWEFNLEKTGLKLALQYTKSEAQSVLTGSYMVDVLYLPRDMKYIGTEFEVINLSSDSHELSGDLIVSVPGVSEIPWNNLMKGNSLSFNSISIRPDEYLRFKCIPLLPGNYDGDFSGRITADGYMTPWILIERKRL